MTDLRTGIGFDLHRLIEGPDLVIGGVTISSEKGPDAHSDGDVLLHAAADACLGAAGLGDIGEQFPDSEPENRNRPGSEMVEEVLRRLGSRDLSVHQIDSTVLLEAPSLGPYKDRIRKQLSSLFNIPADRVEVKATTLEGLGPIGEGDAVAAWVNVLLTAADRHE